jgi:uncharacterized protein (TIGR00369 family)
VTGVTATEKAPVDGLAKIQALLAAGGQPPIGKTLDFALVEVALGRAVFEGTPSRHAYNPMGIVHGGYAATLLDSACGIATASRLAAGEAFTTLEIKIAYHKAMTENTGPVRAEGIVTSMGRRVAYAEAKLTDSDGRLIASATSTLLVMAG